MALRPDSALYRVPAGLVVGTAVALALILALVVGIVGCQGGDDDERVAAATAAGGGAEAGSELEQCVVWHPDVSVIAAFDGLEASNACEQFRIQARDDDGGAGWVVDDPATTPARAARWRVACRLYVRLLAHVTIREQGAASVAAQECARMRREGWRPGVRP